MLSVAGKKKMEKNAKFTNMLKIWNGSQVKTEAPVIKNNVFADLVSVMILLWLHIGDFCFLQIT